MLPTKVNVRRRITQREANFWMQFSYVFVLGQVSMSLWPNVRRRSMPKVLRMGCFCAYFTHVETCDNVRVESATQWTFGTYSTLAQTCDNHSVYYNEN